VPRQAPTDAKRLVGVISQIGGYGGTPSPRHYLILIRNRALASLENPWADDGTASVGDRTLAVLATPGNLH
jgi:hypothetical protein